MSEATNRRHVHVIGCAVMALDIKAVAEELDLEITTHFLPGGLHEEPRRLREQLQAAIDEASGSVVADLIAVAYGVCGMGTVGIHARHIPLAIPRVHDCIAMFLGSDAEYKRQFAQYPGTYYVSAGWVDGKSVPLSMSESNAADSSDARQSARVCAELSRLAEQYGPEDAEAIRYFLSSWQRNYQRAAFIDTGVDAKSRRYERIAREMAERFGWKYERLQGSSALLKQMLMTWRTTPEVLFVPPHHVTVYQAGDHPLAALPVWQQHRPGTTEGDSGNRFSIVVGDDGNGDGETSETWGLGIDAGGTYTDVTLYDFAHSRVAGKAKALTTKWDYTAGIDAALDRLDATTLAKVGLVSVSTTLATNAIVEGRGQPVGLLVMPPYGLFDPEDIAHRPLELVSGRLEIDGTELEPVNEQQVRRVARELVSRQRVAAFAVAGYASHVNPQHELAIKAILRDETGLAVTCGHDVSQGLNYRLRAQTAALNARIIPYLDRLLRRLMVSLQRRGIDAPLMVVRSDGALMNVATALEKPIETILSGPAASVAGARYLTGLKDAIVVDIGGTTTDTALISGGQVRVATRGATVGGWRTHVKALDMRTCGLGGDSIVAFTRGKLSIGPQRVGPVCWLAARYPGFTDALRWLQLHADFFDTTTRRMDLLALNTSDLPDDLDDMEQQVIERLRARPWAVHELAETLRGDKYHPPLVARLEERQIVQRCGLTPTDLLHAQGRLDLWDSAAAHAVVDLVARVLAQPADRLAASVLERFEQHVAVELLKTQLAEEADADELDRSATSQVLVRNLLADRETGWKVRVTLDKPVVGIGAPVAHFLPPAARLLNTRCEIPQDADVANAVGAITSMVEVSRAASIEPTISGQYRVGGIAGTPAFVGLEEAHQHAVAALTESVREAARQAGTDARRILITVDDRVAPLNDGGQIFIERRLEAVIRGKPCAGTAAMASPS